MKIVHPSESKLQTFERRRTLRNRWKFRIIFPTWWQHFRDAARHTRVYPTIPIQKSAAINIHRGKSESNSRGVVPPANIPVTALSSEKQWIISHEMQLLPAPFCCPKVSFCVSATSSTSRTLDNSGLIFALQYFWHFWQSKSSQN